MKTWQRLSSVGVLSLMLLAACGQEETNTTEKETTTQQSTEVTEEQAQFPVTVTDSLNKEITLENAPKRIISLTPSNTEILFGLGLNEEIIGVSDNDNYPEEVLTKEKVGGMEFNLEQLISLQPDLIVAHESGLYSFNEEAITQLEAVGIPVFVVKNAATFEETYTTIEQIGQLTGKTKEATEIIASIQKGIQDIEVKVADLEEKSVFIVVGTEPDLYATGKETFMDEMLQVPNSGIPSVPVFVPICFSVTPSDSVELKIFMTIGSSVGIVFGSIPDNSCNIRITVGSSCPRISSFKILS